MNPTPSLSLAETTYHRVLRVSLVVGALLLVFVSGVVDERTAGLTVRTEQYLATAVGMSARVAPTELNTLTAALTEREQALAAREAALRTRELELEYGGANQANQYQVFILSAILFIFLVLIVLNYTLDYLRYREAKAEQLNTANPTPALGG